MFKLILLSFLTVLTTCLTKQPIHIIELNGGLIFIFFVVAVVGGCGYCYFRFCRRGPQQYNPQQTGRARRFWENSSNSSDSSDSQYIIIHSAIEVKHLHLYTHILYIKLHHLCQSRQIVTTHPCLLYPRMTSLVLSIKTCFKILGKDLII